MRLTPQTLTGDRLVASVASKSRPGITHTVYGNRATGAVWCGETCDAQRRGILHNHHVAMRRLFTDLRVIQANQRQMSDEMLSHQVEWLHPDRVGFVSLAYLSAQDILYSRQTEAA